jgi:phage tail sheath gpL-like
VAISLNSIPGNIRVPFAWFEVNPGQAPYQTISRLLLIGQMTSSGSAAADQPIIVTGQENGLFGSGSMLAAMYNIARVNAPFQEIWALPLSDAMGSTAATGTVTLNQAAPLASPEQIVLYVGGLRVTANVTTTMTNTSIASAITTAINDCPYMQVHAANVVGVKAKQSVTYTLPAPGAATYLPVTIGSLSLSVLVNTTDTPSIIAANVASEINSNSTLFTATAVGATVTVTAVSTGTFANSYTLTTQPAAFGTSTTTSFAGGTSDVVTLTANNKGTIGNGIRIETHLNADDAWAADTLLTIVQMSNGVGDPSITTALVNLGDDLWDFIGMPYASAAYLSEMDAWLNNRWSPNSQTYGLNFTGMVGKTAGQTIAFTSVRNNPFTYVLPMYNSPQPASLLTAAFAAQAAVHLQTPPELSLPMQTLNLIGIRGPKLVSDRWAVPTLQSFYYAGASGYDVDKSGNVRLNRVVSTYQRDTWGNADQSWLDVNTLAQLMYGVRFMRAYITEKYPRAGLVDSNPNHIAGFVTVNDIHAALVHAYQQLVAVGVFENADLFATLLVVERNASDPNRVDAYIPTDAANQLRIFAASVTSFLQFPA